MLLLRPVAYDDAHPLVAALGREMTERYGGGEPSQAEPADFLPPHGVFLVAEVAGVPAGCGGVRRWSADVAEVKRMYVVPAYRGRGVARALLAALVEHSRAAGFGEVRLETGTAQPEAMALYESAGFVAIPPYGQYRDHPESRCYALRL